MTREKILRAILRKRGYLVLWQAPYHSQFSVGTRTSELGAECINLGIFAVRAKTSKADFLAQQVLSKKLEPKNWKHCSPSGFVKDMSRKVKGAMIFWKVTPTRAKPRKLKN